MSSPQPSSYRQHFQPQPDFPARLPRVLRRLWSWL